MAPADTVTSLSDQLGYSEDRLGPRWTDLKVETLKWFKARGISDRAHRLQSPDSAEALNAARQFCEQDDRAARLWHSDMPEGILHGILEDDSRSETEDVAGFADEINSPYRRGTYTRPRRPPTHLDDTSRPSNPPAHMLEPSCVDEVDCIERVRLLSRGPSDSERPLTRKWLHGQTKWPTGTKNYLESFMHEKNFYAKGHLPRLTILPSTGHIIELARELKRMHPDLSLCSRNQDKTLRMRTARMIVKKTRGLVSAGFIETRHDGMKRKSDVFETAWGKRQTYWKDGSSLGFHGSKRPEHEQSSIPASQTQRKLKRPSKANGTIPRSGSRASQSIGPIFDLTSDPAERDDSCIREGLGLFNEFNGVPHTLRPEVTEEGPSSSSGPTLNTTSSGINTSPKTLQQDENKARFESTQNYARAGLDALDSSASTRINSVEAPVQSATHQKAAIELTILEFFDTIVAPGLPCPIRELPDLDFQNCNVETFFAWYAAQSNCPTPIESLIFEFELGYRAPQKLSRGDDAKFARLKSTMAKDRGKAQRSNPSLSTYGVLVLVPGVDVHATPQLQNESDSEL
ncbi:MAG: hypothetical protein M1818_005709 [Claussenomyces sp. TS43310]|nr:MAG: hypothetical protein M1818_005709 [Claussenomyces sp. TS43310]